MIAWSLASGYCFSRSCTLRIITARISDTACKSASRPACSCTRVGGRLEGDEFVPTRDITVSGGSWAAP
jgi:hypothetical protein